MSRTPHPCRAGAALAAAVVLLAACGGEDGSASGSASSSSPAPSAAQTGETTASGSGAGDFCAQAAGIDERVETALDGIGDDDPSVRDAFDQIAAELRAVQAPEPIAADWAALADGLDRTADALADLDLTDPQSLAGLEDVGDELSTASDHVEAYLRDECGTGTSGAAPTS
ncbi:hypothetical protein [Geodermatophilus sp. URMC 62]|uniref:hypothetical protein n=1 Tax=Geodermatophilus sp. URMC 62 TaxID=3423414 RepID=UPI00406D0EDB